MRAALEEQRLGDARLHRIGLIGLSDEEGGLGTLAGCCLFLTGNWIWLGRRDRQRRQLGNRILARLTIAFGAGLAIASAATLLGSRLLPLGPDRTPYEVVFAVVWSATLIGSFLPRRELSAW